MPRTRRQRELAKAEEESPVVPDGAALNLLKGERENIVTPEPSEAPRPADIVGEAEQSSLPATESLPAGAVLNVVSAVSSDSKDTGGSPSDLERARTGEGGILAPSLEPSLSHDAGAAHVATGQSLHQTYQGSATTEQPTQDSEVQLSLKDLKQQPDQETTPLRIPSSPPSLENEVGNVDAVQPTTLQARDDHTIAENSHQPHVGTEGNSPVPPSPAHDDESVRHDDLLDDDNLPPVVRRKRIKVDSAVSAEEFNALTETGVTSQQKETSPLLGMSSIPRRSKTSAFPDESTSPLPEKEGEESAEIADERQQIEDGPSEKKESPIAEQASATEETNESWNPTEPDDSAKLRPAMNLKEAAEYLQTLPRRHPDGINDARLFIGNLASESTSQVELLSIFSKYGNIIEQPLMLRSYAFIQYEHPESTQLAIRYEQGRMIGGRHLDLSVASGRRGSASGSTNNPNASDSHHYIGTGSGPEGKRSLSNPGMNRRKRDASSIDTGGSRPPPRPGAPYVRILVIGTTSRPMAHAMQNVIRSLGISADVAYIFSNHLGTALKEAYAQCVRYMIVVTSKDASRGACSLRTYEKTGYEHASGGNIMPFHEALAIIFREERINLPVPPAAYTVASAAMSHASAGGDTTNMATMLPGTAPGIGPGPPSVAATTPYGYPNPMISAAGGMPYPFASMAPGYLYGPPGPPPPPPPSAPSAPAGVSTQRGYPGYMAAMPPGGISAPMVPPHHGQVTGNTAYSTGPPTGAPPGADMNQVKQLLATLQQFQQRNASTRNGGGSAS
jgi:hypothetical protein